MLFTKMHTLFADTVLHIEVTETDIVPVSTTTDHVGQTEAIEMDGVVKKMRTMTLGLAEAGKSQGFKIHILSSLLCFNLKHGEAPGLLFYRDNTNG